MIDPTPAPSPPPPPPPPLTGAYKVWPADANGDLMPTDQPANPSDPKAVELYFGLLESSTPPPKEQSDLQIAIGEALDTVKTLYIDQQGVPAPSFRLYYTRLFRIAELGLEGNAMPDFAKVSLDRIVDDLVDAEGARVKNAHLGRLGIWALILAGAFLALYLAICLLATRPLLPYFGVDPTTAKSFMLLWIGCFGGVWLSYAIRTTALKLRDLVVPDADRLLPLTRLIFAGLLTMILGLLLALGFVDVRVGGESLAAFTRDPMKALLLGLFCGVSELLLPSMVGKRAGDLVEKFR
jgi:hypothetical protein